ncbi:hypothetical protein VTO73DRAFT_3288 [Trametes versicolor]
MAGGQAECAPRPDLQAVTAARSTATHSASRGRGDAARRATEPARRQTSAASTQGSPFTLAIGAALARA